MQQDNRINIDGLIEMIGREFEMRTISNTLCGVVRDLKPGVVGALHLTCADETEYECARAFRTEFTQRLLPQLKTGHQTAFRLSNLGARYEKGSIGLTEDHFRLPAGQLESGYKVIVAKLNSHVGVIGESASRTYGRIERYGLESTCCGALAALMAGKNAPFLEELRDAFQSGGKDLLAPLLDETKVQNQYRALYAAVISSGQQALKLLNDLRAHTPDGPAVYLVLPCVSINRPGEDTEILCGVHLADHRTDIKTEQYTGLGDDPSSYVHDFERDSLCLRDENTRTAE